MQKTGRRMGGHPELALDDLFQIYGGFRFGREFKHDLSATNGKVILVERVESLFAFLANVDEARVAQDGEVMRNGWLGEADLFHDLVDRQPATTTLAHNSLACVICNGFGKENRIEFHGKTFKDII